ncbi:MAG: hypothetical protein IIV05_01600 [Ruminococcus sp.]|nr:hypothetical protein [Ruminococcus sp.]
MKAKMMRLTNMLIALLEECDDDDFVDNVICAIADGGDPFTEDEISAAEAEGL